MTDKRFSIIVENFNSCIICGSMRGIHKHEAFFGTANRKLSIKYGLVVPLCYNCHTGSNIAVHRNYFADIKIKQIAQKAFEEKYSHEEFMKVFKKNYL